MWHLLLLFIILVGIVLVTYVYQPQFLKFRRLFKFSYTIPGPPYKEFVQSAREERILTFLEQSAHRYGTIFRIWLGKDLFLFISDPEDIKTVLSSTKLLYKSPNYRLVEPWLGLGLLTSSGEMWHRRRKMLTPAFHFKVLSVFQQPMEENCNILINKLKNVANGENIVNIYSYITLFALDVICETAMGIKKHAQMKSDSDYVQAVQTMCRVLQSQIFSAWKRFPLLYQFSDDAKATHQALNVLHGETERVIIERRKLLETDGLHKLKSTVTYQSAEDDANIGLKRRLAFLDMLLIAQMEGVPITDREIREEVDTFMFEGHDTTSSAIAFIIYLLAQHPEEQEKLYQNLTQATEKDSIKYLEAVIKEGLRLFPSVPSFSRVLKEDFQIRDHIIPEGTNIAVFAYMAHRDPKEYPEPYKFVPERFLQDKENHPYSFVPFSAGPRNCIGQKFAMLELKCTIASLVKNFQFLAAPGFELKPQTQLILRSTSGVSVILKSRVS